MIKLKSTHEILTMPWKESTNCIPIGGKIPQTWKGNTPLTINDIDGSLSQSEKLKQQILDRGV